MIFATPCMELAAPSASKAQCEVRSFPGIGRLRGGATFSAAERRWL